MGGMKHMNYSRVKHLVNKIQNSNSNPLFSIIIKFDANYLTVKCIILKICHVIKFITRHLTMTSSECGLDSATDVRMVRATTLSGTLLYISWDTILSLFTYIKCNLIWRRLLHIITNINVLFKLHSSYGLSVY